MTDKPILYSYWRSSCSWRVRTALELKGIEYEYRPVHLVKKEQSSPEYLEKNPAGFVPTFIHNGNTISESLAIMEYIDEVFPQQPKLISGNAAEKALIRSLALVFISNIQPLQNLCTIVKYGGDDQAKRAEWANHFIQRGLQTAEARLQKTSGKYSVGDNITLVDLCIPSQIYGAERFGVDLTPFPTVSRINKTLAEIPAFIKADEKHCPDTPEEFR